MKLRNKKTGEIVDWNGVHITSDNDGEMFYSIAELNDEWEDVKEPLIKDEKIRKAVRAWAEANGFVEDIEIHTLPAGATFSVENYDIGFIGCFIDGLEAGMTFKIEELCGEEEG